MLAVTSALLVGLLLCTQSTPQHVATKPVDRLNEDWWKQRHEHCVELTKKGGMDVVFLGDSITQGWEDGGKGSWVEATAGLSAGNFGFSGDRTEHVLWRLAHGEIVGLNPKVIVMMIGTNNIGHGSSNAEQTADGVRAIVSVLRDKLPNSKILLLGIFPRGEDSSDPMRIAVHEATEKFKSLNDGQNVFFEDIGYAFTSISGHLRTQLMPDMLHLTPDGYSIWARAIGSIVKKLAN